MVFNPYKRLVVDYYAYVYFTGLWGHDNPQDPIFTKSRNGSEATFFHFPSIVGVRTTDLHFFLYSTFLVCGIVSFC